MDEQDLLRRLKLGVDDDRAWLTPGEAALVLGTNRVNINRQIHAGLLRWRFRTGSGRHRVLHPDDIQTRLADKERVYRVGEIDEVG